MTLKHLSSTIQRLSYARRLATSNKPVSKKRAAFREDTDAKLTLELLSITKRPELLAAAAEPEMSTEGSDSDHN